MANILSKVMWWHMERGFRAKLQESGDIPLLIFVPSYGMAKDEKRLTYMAKESLRTLVERYPASYTLPKHVILSHVYPGLSSIEKELKHQMLPYFLDDGKLVDLFTDDRFVSTFSEVDTFVEYLVHHKLHWSLTSITIIAERDHMPRVVRDLLTKAPDVRLNLLPFESKHEAHLAVPWYKGLINTPFLGIWMWWHFSMYVLVVFRDWILRKQPY